MNKQLIIMLTITVFFSAPIYSAAKPESKEVVEHRENVEAADDDARDIIKRELNWAPYAIQASIISYYVKRGMEFEHQENITPPATLETGNEIRSSLTWAHDIIRALVFSYLEFPSCRQFGHHYDWRPKILKNRTICYPIGKYTMVMRDEVTGDHCEYVTDTREPRVTCDQDNTMAFIASQPCKKDGSLKNKDKTQVTIFNFDDKSPVSRSIDLPMKNTEKIKLHSGNIYAYRSDARSLQIFNVAGKKLAELNTGCSIRSLTFPGSNRLLIRGRGENVEEVVSLYDTTSPANPSLIRNVALGHVTQPAPVAGYKSYNVISFGQDKILKAEQIKACSCCMKIEDRWGEFKIINLATGVQGPVEKLHKADHMALWQSSTNPGVLVSCMNGATTLIEDRDNTIIATPITAPSGKEDFFAVKSLQIDERRFVRFYVNHRYFDRFELWHLPEKSMMWRTFLNFHANIPQRIRLSPVIGGVRITHPNRFTTIVKVKNPVQEAYENDRDPKDAVSPCKFPAISSVIMPKPMSDKVRSGCCLIS